MMNFFRLTLLVLCMGIGMLSSKGYAEKSLGVESLESSQGNPAYSLENLLEDRVLGDPNAPVEIVEFSSMSCPHCKIFHDNTLDRLKKEYIDTGKVKLRFSDFPLNRAALQASMIARCMPDSLYFQYVDFLFETQEDWAFMPEPLPYLKQNAKLVGLSEENFRACYDQDGYTDAFIKAVQEDGAKYGIKATPTFIFSQSGTRFSGAKTFEEFELVIKEHLEN